MGGRGGEAETSLHHQGGYEEIQGEPMATPTQNYVINSTEPKRNSDTHNYPSDYSRKHIHSLEYLRKTTGLPSELLCSLTPEEIRLNLTPEELNRIESSSEEDEF